MQETIEQLYEHEKEHEKSETTSTGRLALSYSFVTNHTFTSRYALFHHSIMEKSDNNQRQAISGSTSGMLLF